MKLKIQRIWLVTDNDYEDNIGGIEAVRRIRDFDKQTIILLQTADLTEDARINALETGADYALKKTDYSGLIEILNKR